MDPMVHAYTACCLGSKSLLGCNSFCVQVFYAIVKIVIVTPYFNRPSLLSMFLAGWCTVLETCRKYWNSSLKQLCNTDKSVIIKAINYKTRIVLCVAAMRPVVLSHYSCDIDFIYNSC